MIKADITGPGSSAMERFARSIRERIEQSALVATDEAASLATSRIRTAMAGAGLGRLGLAIGSTSDLKLGKGVHRTPSGFSASGVVHVRGRNERTLGAIESYTVGASIVPRNGGWLWIASQDLQKRVGRKKMTPAGYNASGLPQKIGPLVSIPGRHAGERLLIVRDVTTRLMGKASPLRLPRNGRVRPGRELQASFVAFVGIKSTSRQARVNPREIIEGVRRELPTLLATRINRSL